MEVGALKLVEVLRDVECGRILKGVESFFGHVLYVAREGLRIQF